MGEPLMTAKQMFGRRVIYTSADAITADNVAKEVEQAYNTHLLNVSEIEYLWNYYKGKQPSLYRVRETRNELTAHIVENRANEIVSFKTGYINIPPVKLPVNGITYLKTYPRHSYKNERVTLNIVNTGLSEHLIYPDGSFIRQG